MLTLEPPTDEREILVRADSSTDPGFNLRVEDEIFDGVGSGMLPQTLRFWTNSACLVRGRRKSPRYGWYNEELAERLGIPVYGRSTGGGVVYHDPGNLNWSLFLFSPRVFLAPKDVFGLASGFVVKALERLGLRAYFGQPNRVEIESRKICGMAARESSSTLLIHGTLLLNSDLDRINQLCLPPDGCPPVSNITEWKKDIGKADVIRSFVDVLNLSGFDLKDLRVLPSPRPSTPDDALESDEDSTPQSRYLS